MANLVRIRLEELVVILELLVDSVRQIAVRTGGVGTVRMNVPVEHLQDRALNGRQRFTIEVLLLLELRGQELANVCIINWQCQGFI